MKFWQASDISDRLQIILYKERFFQRHAMQQVTLHLYSAGRRHIGCDGQHWKEEIFSSERRFRSDVQHDGHVSVTGLYSEKRFYWPNFEQHHISGLNLQMQEQIVNRKKFTDVLILLHERLSRSVQA